MKMSAILIIAMLQQSATKTITQLQYVEWPQVSCPNNSTSIVGLIEILKCVQRKTANGPTAGSYLTNMCQSYYPSISTLFTMSKDEVLRIVNLDILIIPLVCSQILLQLTHVQFTDQTITFYSKRHQVYVIKKVSM